MGKKCATATCSAIASALLSLTLANSLEKLGLFLEKIICESKNKSLIFFCALNKVWPSIEFTLKLLTVLIIYLKKEVKINI